MSRYRSLHRMTIIGDGGDGDDGNNNETTTTCPIFQIAAATSSPSQKQLWNFWIATGNGTIETFSVQEKTAQDNASNVLDASALTCTKITQQTAGGNNKKKKNNNNTKKSKMAFSQVQVIRNYVGQDDQAGDIIVIGLELSGVVHVWKFDNESSSPTLEPTSTFSMPNATGTKLVTCPPRISGVGNVQALVPCYNGNIQLIALGLQTPKSTIKSPPEPGTVLHSWNHSQSIVLSIAWHPLEFAKVVVGRQNGTMDVLNPKTGTFSQISSGYNHVAPIRSLTFTTDGNLLLSASQDGMICVWDTLRNYTLVHQVVQAHQGWIMDIQPIDARRFVSTGTDQRIHVWTVGPQLDQPTHSFITNDTTIWSLNVFHPPSVGIITTASSPRLLTSNDQGGIQIYSLEP